MESNKLIDENGEYKDKASIAEIAKSWDIKSYENTCLQVINEIKQGRFECHFPKGVYNEVEAVTLKCNKVYGNDIRDYLIIVQSYIRERLIHEAFNEPFEEIDYKKTLSNTKSIKKIAKGTLIWGELNPVSRQQGLAIFPLYSFEKHPAKEPYICEGADFYEWFNSLTEAEKNSIESNLIHNFELNKYGNIISNTHADTNEHIKNIEITQSAFIALLRHLQLNQNREGLRADLLNILLFGCPNFKLLIKETGECAQYVAKSVYEKYVHEIKKFKVEFSHHIYLSQSSFNRWLRRFPSVREESYNKDDKIIRRFPAENLDFWGGQWLEQPQSYEFENKDSKEYRLYDAMRYWSDPEDIRDLQLKEYACSKYTDFNKTEELSFMQIKNIANNFDSNSKRRYNEFLELIINKFINHVVEGRLVVKGIKKGETTTCVIDKNYFKKLARDNKIDWVEGETKDGLYWTIDVVKAKENDEIKMATIESKLKAFINNYRGEQITRDGLIELFESSFPRFKGRLTTDSRPFRRAWELLNEVYKLTGAPRKS